MDEVPSTGRWVFLLFFLGGGTIGVAPYYLRMKKSAPCLYADRERTVYINQKRNLRLSTLLLQGNGMEDKTGYWYSILRWLGRCGGLWLPCTTISANNWFVWFILPNGVNPNPARCVGSLDVGYLGGLCTSIRCRYENECCYCEYLCECVCWLFHNDLIVFGVVNIIVLQLLLYYWYLS